MNSKIEPKKKNPNKSIINGSISFENVSYTYEDTNIKALKGISFTVKKGETLAILGNRVGKSTILSLISRLYDVTDGKLPLTIRRLAFKS
jgi:ATP-binding cassette subfamily B protein